MDGCNNCNQVGKWLIVRRPTMEATPSAGTFSSIGRVGGVVGDVLLNAKMLIMMVAKFILDLLF